MNFIMPIHYLVLFNAVFQIQTREWKFYFTYDCSYSSFILISSKWTHNPSDWIFWSYWSAYYLSPVEWLIRFPWKCMYSSSYLWWFLDGIHVIFLWHIIFVILWILAIIIGFIDFMGLIYSMVFLIILLIICLHILIHVVTCGIILFLSVLIFDIVFILLTSLLIHYCNIRHLIHSCSFVIIISDRINFSIIKN